MGLPSISVSKKITISKDTYSKDQTYIYKAKSGQYVLLREFSVGADQSFIDSGHYQLKIKGKIITNDDSEFESELLRGFNVPFDPKDDVYLEPNQEIEVKFRGFSGTVQVQIVGHSLSESEFQKRRKKEGWD